MRFTFPGTRSALVADIAEKRTEYAAALPDLIAEIRATEAAATAAIAARDAAAMQLHNIGYAHEGFVGKAEKALRDTADPRVAGELALMRRLFNEVRGLPTMDFTMISRLEDGSTRISRPTRMATLTASVKSIRAATARLEQMQLAALSHDEIGRQILDIRGTLQLTPELRIVIDEVQARERATGARAAE